MYFGADYYPEHWPEERWVTDARLMEEAGFNVVRMAEFAWTRMEPREGAFDFDWLDRAIALLADHGIQTVLGTPTAAPPAWLMRAYPECFLMDEHGQRLTFGHRRNTCPTQPIYREYSARIVQAMADHFATNPHVIGWQIDNEFGDRCYCPACQRAFQEWLKVKYGSLEALNAAWGTEFWSHTYTAWQEIPVPLRTAYTHNPGLALDYRRFMSDTYVEYQALQVEILRRRAPGQFITHNFMGFGYPKLDYFDLAADLDFVAWDNYPRFRGKPDLAALALSHDTMRGLKGANFWVMEAQSGPAGQLETGTMPRPGEIPFWAWQAIAHGADGIVFFRWRTCRFGAEEYWHGILDHDGIPRRRYREVAEMGAALQRIGGQITGSKRTAQAAMLLSYDSRFALQGQPVNPHLSYERLFLQYYRALWAHNIGVDVVPPCADLSRYRLVVAPLLYVLDEPTAQRLRDYVAGGGLLVVTCRSGVVDPRNTVVDQALPGLLAEICGVEVDEYDSLDADMRLTLSTEGPLGEATFGASVWADVLAPRGATVVARYASEYYAGRAAVTVHAFGAGHAVYVGTLAEQALIERLIGHVCEELALSPALAVPAGVEVTERTSGDTCLRFVLNGTQQTQTLTLAGAWRDLLSERVLTGAVTLDPLGVLVLQQA